MILSCLRYTFKKYSMKLNVVKYFFKQCIYKSNDTVAAEFRVLNIL